MRYGSVCSGIEAATMAWHPLGWSPAFFSEIEAFPSAVLAHHYGSNMPGEPLAKNGVPNHGDFTTISEDAGPIDLLVGGTPCQSFSVAGRRLGLDDPRGNLALEYLALARRLRARWIVWENVPGVLSSRSGDEPAEGEEGVESADFATFLSFVQECGYGFAYRVLDAQYVRVDGFRRAVPQRRRRVFVVGYLGDWRRAAAVLLEPQGMRRDSPPRRKAGQAVAGTISASSGRRGGLPPADTADSLIACGGGSVAIPLLAGGHGNNPIDENLIAHTLRGTGFDASEDGSGRGTPIVPVIAKTLTRGAESSGKGGYAGRRQEDDDNLVAYAIQAGATRENPDAGPDGIGVQADVAYTLEARAEVQAMQHRWAVRRLTPRECERLQGFPDDFTAVPYRGKAAADGPRYKALGNSMAVNVMRWIGYRIDTMEKLIASGRIPA